VSVRPQLIGILNVTPDSFYDGGELKTIDLVLKRAEQMLADGADILEIGGQSTGPNSKDISIHEEQRRVLPVIEAVRARFPQARLSVDTFTADLAQAAIDRGVEIINDVTAGRGDARIFAVLAHSSASVVLMYAKDLTARTTIAPTRYDDVIVTIRLFLAERKRLAVEAGIAPERIILDPGLGQFISSDPRYSFEILARLSEFLPLDCPILVSPSRKSFLAGSEQLPTADRLPATVAASSIAVLHGASFIRTHDVLEVRRACNTAQSVWELKR